MFLRKEIQSMSVNPVSQSNAAPPVQNPAAHKSQAPAAAPQDTVQLSAQGKAAAGDADHDGDSH
jgi:hypothetical protein